MDYERQIQTLQTAIIDMGKIIQDQQIRIKNLSLDVENLKIALDVKESEFYEDEWE